MSKNIERRINFYQIIWIKNDKSSVTKDINYINSILSGCAGIRKGDRYNIILEKYMHITEPTVLDKGDTNGETDTQNGKSFWIISKYKKDDLPLKFNETDKLSGGLDLKDDEGLQAPTHFVVFDGKFIGAEYNHDGIRSISSNLGGAINKYIKDKSLPGIEHVEILPVLRSDVYKLINKVDEITSIEIKVATDYAKRLSYDDSKPISLERDLFSSSKVAAEGMYLNLTYSVGRRKPKRINEIRDLLAAIKQIMSRTDYKDHIKTLKIKGKYYDGGPDETQPIDIDLLSQLMMEEKRIATLDDKTKAVNKTIMFEEIIKSYNSMKEDLEQLKYPTQDWGEE